MVGNGFSIFCILQSNLPVSAKLPGTSRPWFDAEYDVIIAKIWIGLLTEASSITA